CTKDNTLLMPETETRHICPVCGSVYTDERTSAAYRTHINYKIDKNCVILAKAYAFTKDEKYSERVKQILLTLARLYPLFERHDRWGRKGLLAVVGGRRYCQNLDEAISAIDLASAYDLIANSSCLSEQDREIIEKFLKDIVKEILKYQIFHGGKNNHQTWFNAAYSVVGLITGDEELMKESIYGRFGLLWQIENSITADGLWYEGTIAYHFYALAAIQHTLDAARRIGWDFSKNSRLKSMWLGPLQLSYPDGRLPAFNDGDPLNLRNYSQFFLWASRYFGDTIFSKYADISNFVQETELKSTNLSDIGIAVLRKGKGQNQVCAMLDYGIHGDSHGHPDKLNIVLFANGKEFLLDPGRISYSVPEYRTWCRTTVSHNTIVIDEKDQQPATGKLLYFEDTDEYSVCFASCDSAYPGYILKRFLVLTEKFLVDVFSVEGRKKVDIDWIIHFRGQIKEDKKFVVAELKNSENGYQHLKNLRKIDEKNDPAIFEIFQDKENLIKLFLLKNENSIILSGMGIGYHLKDSVPFIMRRKNSSVVTFVAVYDFSSDVKEARMIPVYGEKGSRLSENEVVGIKILTASETFEIGVSLRDKISVRVFDNREKFKRFLFRKV
ncbi:MAG: heparinase II/III family protein, partial [Candidatus Omnitrophica bacterium]|nr:heparinase II/III family protein [Candidatus Omnitrophota bacterium]